MAESSSSSSTLSTSDSSENDSLSIVDTDTPSSSSSGDGNKSNRDTRSVSQNEGNKNAMNKDYVEEKKGGSNGDEGNETENENENEDEDENEKVKKSEVIGWIEDGLLVKGPAPKDHRKFRSKMYTSEGGIKFLFWNDDGSEFLNWYACEHCDWVGFCIHKKGTSGLSKHAQKHSEEQQRPYQVEKRALAEILAAATNYGQKYGCLQADFIEQNMPNDSTTLNSNSYWQSLASSRSNQKGNFRSVPF